MDHKTLRSALAGCLLAFAAQTAYADELDEKMQEIRKMFSSPHTEEGYYRTDRLLVTATGSLVPVFKAPSVASVITKEDIEAMGATTLDEVLETVPGLHVGASGTALLSPIYSIRGIHTSVNPQVLLLFNGVPFQFPNDGARILLFRIPVVNISRIEVVRGPGSAVHGADAFAGTINIITKDGFEIDGNRAGLRAGSFDTYDGWAQHGGQYHGWDVAASAEYVRSHGDDDRVVDSDLQSFFDRAFGTNASLAPSPLDTRFEQLDAHYRMAKGNWTFTSWFHGQDDGGAGPGVANVLTCGSEVDSEQFLLDFKYNTKTLLKGFDLTARASHVYQHLDAFYEILPPGSVVAIGTDGNIGAPPIAGFVLFTEGSYGYPQVTDLTTSLNLEAIYNDIPSHRIRMATGISFQNEEIEQLKNNGPGVLDSITTTLLPPPAINVQGPEMTDVSGTQWVYLPDNNRTLWNVSLQDEWTISSKWDLVAGVRYDHYSDFGETINPRAALIWETRYDLSTKLMYGTAFRPPNFLEQKAKNNPAVMGNPSLDPEKIQVWELAFDYQPFTKLRTVLSAFTYEVDDLIEYVPDPALGTTKTAQNIKNQEGHGFELEVSWEITKELNLNGNYAFQRSKDEQTKELTIDAPENQFYLNGHWRFLPDWSLNASYHWLGNRHRKAGDPRPEIDGYDKVDLVLRRKNIAGHWEFALAMKNVFDEDIREASDFNAALPLGSPIPGDYPMEGRNVWGEVSFHF